MDLDSVTIELIKLLIITAVLLVLLIVPGLIMLWRSVKRLMDIER